MPDRLKEYLDACLVRVPESRYRERLRQELSEHYEDLAEGFLARGYEESEAGLRAMEKLGSPEKLREELGDAWSRQPERLRRDLGRLVLGCCLAGAGTVLSYALLGYLGSAQEEAVKLRRSLGAYGDPRWRLFAQSVLFAGQTLPCFVWLRLRFHRSPRRRAWVTAGLALAWVLGKALLLLDAGNRGFPSLPSLLGTLGAVLAIGLVFS
jgi:hypothetical protein